MQRHGAIHLPYHNVVSTRHGDHNGCRGSF